MKASALALGLFSIVFSASVAMAGDTPDKLDGAQLVDAKKASELVKDKSVKVYDVRVKLEFSEEHLPGAISLPYGEKSKKEVGFDASADKFDVAQLPADKNAPILIYCNGPECWKSFKASTAAVKAGHKKVNWFRGGLPEWKKAGLQTEK